MVAQEHDYQIKGQRAYIIQNEKGQIADIMQQWLHPCGQRSIQETIAHNQSQPQPDEKCNWELINHVCATNSEITATDCIICGVELHSANKEGICPAGTGCNADLIKSVTTKQEQEQNKPKLEQPEGDEPDNHVAILEFIKTEALSRMPNTLENRFGNLTHLNLFDARKILQPARALDESPQMVTVHGAGLMKTPDFEKIPSAYANIAGGSKILDALQMNRTGRVGTAVCTGNFQGEGAEQRKQLFGKLQTTEDLDNLCTESAQMMIKGMRNIDTMAAFTSQVTCWVAFAIGMGIDPIRWNYYLRADIPAAQLALEDNILAKYAAYCARKFGSFSSVANYISAQKTLHSDLFNLHRPKMDDLPALARILTAAEKFKIMTNPSKRRKDILDAVSIRKISQWITEQIKQSKSYTEKCTLHMSRAIIAVKFSYGLRTKEILPGRGFKAGHWTLKDLIGFANMPTNMSASRASRTIHTKQPLRKTGLSKAGAERARDAFVHEYVLDELSFAKCMEEFFDYLQSAENTMPATQNPLKDKKIMSNPEKMAKIPAFWNAGKEGFQPLPPQIFRTQFTLAAASTFPEAASKGHNFSAGMIRRASNAAMKSGGIDQADRAMMHGRAPKNKSTREYDVQLEGRCLDIQQTARQQTFRSLDMLCIEDKDSSKTTETEANSIDMSQEEIIEAGELYGQGVQFYGEIKRAKEDMKNRWTLTDNQADMIIRSTKKEQTKPQSDDLNWAEVPAPGEMVSTDLSHSAAIRNLRLLQTKADGSCMFHSIVLTYTDYLEATGKGYVHSPPLSSQELRKQACQRIERNKSQYQAYITQGTYKQEQKFQTYLAKMKKTGVWGDEVVLRAIADLLQVSITVLHSAGNAHEYKGGNGAELHIAFDQKRQHYLGTALLQMSALIYRPHEMRGLHFKNSSGKPMFPSKQELKQLQHELANLNLRLGQSTIGTGIGIFATKKMNPPTTQPGFHSSSKKALLFKGVIYLQKEWREITKRAEEVNFPPEEKSFDLVAATRFPYAIEHTLQENSGTRNIIIDAGDKIACAARYAQHSSGESKNCIMISQDGLPQPFLALTEQVNVGTEIAWDYTDLTNHTSSEDNESTTQEMPMDESSSDEQPSSPSPRKVKLLPIKAYQQRDEQQVPTSSPVGNAVWSPGLKQKQEKKAAGIDVKDKRRKSIKHLTGGFDKTTKTAEAIKAKRHRSARQLAGSLTTTTTIPNILRAAQKVAAKKAEESAATLATLATGGNNNETAEGQPKPTE